MWGPLLAALGTTGAWMSSLWVFLHTMPAHISSFLSFEMLISFILNLFWCIYFACSGRLNSGPWSCLPSLCSWFSREEHVSHLSTKAFVWLVRFFEFCFLRSSIRSLIVTESKISSCPSGFMILICLVKTKQNAYLRAEEMAQPLRALSAPPEDPALLQSSVPLVPGTQCSCLVGTGHTSGA